MELLDEVGEDYSILEILDTLPIDNQRQQKLKHLPRLFDANVIDVEMPYRREEKKKISPNEKCPCRSGKKYKFCCGKK